MPTTCSDFPPKSLQTKQKDGGFFSTANSLEDYHGGASASVPFTWESQPGTPKKLEFRETTAPIHPLTPPPAHYSAATKRPVRKRSRPSLLHAIFTKGNSWKARLPSSPAFSPSSSSSSSSSSFTSSPSPRSNNSVPSSPITALTSHRRGRMSSPRLSFDSRTEGEEQEYHELPAVSALCFSRGVTTDRWFRGCCSSIIKVFLRD
jgi:hypothetical protein